MSYERPSEAGLYLHVPFCSAICPYCDFAVMKGGDERRQRFIEALVAEIGLYGETTERFDTVYFGGGTPSLMRRVQLERILDTLRERLVISTQPWIGLEANPEDVSPRSLEVWRGLGITTVSLGVQSFVAANLEFLGRVHEPRIAHRSAELTLAAGFDSVSIDLIYGLPGQTLEEWKRDLDAVVALRPQHVSCYQLTVHEKTVFGVRRRRGQLVELAAGAQAELFLETHRHFARAGYEGYEVSNFASAPEHRSRHNSKYWDHSRYLGLGPSAHSFDGSERWWNERKEGPWSRKVLAGEPPVAGREALSTSDLVLERLMLGLRTVDGVDLEEIDREYGTDIGRANATAIERLEGAGKVTVVGQRLKPTLAGLAIADSLALEFEIPMREIPAPEIPVPGT